MTQTIAKSIVHRVNHEIKEFWFIKKQFPFSPPTKTDLTKKLIVACCIVLIYLFIYD